MKFKINITNKTIFKNYKLNLSQEPHSHILLTGKGGGPRVSFGSEILAKRDFFGSMNDMAIFLGHENLNTGIFWGIILYFSSAKINNDISAIYC